MGTPPATKGAGPLDSSWEIPRPCPRYPSLSLAHGLCLVKVLLGSVACGKSPGPPSDKEGFCFPEQLRRDPVKVL